MVICLFVFSNKINSLGMQFMLLGLYISKHQAGRCCLPQNSFKLKIPSWEMCTNHQLTILMGASTPPQWNISQTFSNWNIIQILMFPRGCFSNALQTIDRWIITSGRNICGPQKINPVIFVIPWSFSQHHHLATVF